MMSQLALIKVHLVVSNKKNRYLLTKEVTRYIARAYSAKLIKYESTSSAKALSNCVKERVN